MGILALLFYTISPVIWKDSDFGHIPFWIVLICHAAMGLGTLIGGWRIVKTMGSKITKLDPFGGFCAESGAAVTLFATAAAGIPVSTTHTIAGSIVGFGSDAAAQRRSLGDDRQHRLGLDTHHPRRRLHGGRGIPCHLVCGTAVSVSWGSLQDGESDDADVGCTPA